MRSSNVLLEHMARSRIWHEIGVRHGLRHKWPTISLNATLLLSFALSVGAFSAIQAWRWRAWVELNERTKVREEYRSVIEFANTATGHAVCTDGKKLWNVK